MYPKGFEPLRFYSPAPQAGASADSAMDTKTLEGSLGKYYLEAVHICTYVSKGT